MENGECELQRAAQMKKIMLSNDYLGLRRTERSSNVVRVIVRGTQTKSPQ